MRRWKARAVGMARAVTIGAFAVSLLPVGAGARGAASPDLAAAMIQPADVRASGYHDYGYEFGATYSFEEWFRRFISAEGELPDYGATSVTTLGLDPIGGLQDAAGPAYSFTSSAVTYVDEDAVVADFPVLRDEWTAGGAELIEEDAGIGDESFIITWEDSAPVENPDHAATIVSVYFRTGNIQGDFSITGYDAEVNVDDAVELASIYEERIETLLTDGEVDGKPAPGLSSRVPRYVGDSLMTGRSHYVVFDGEAVADARDPELVDVQQARAEEYNMIAEYAGTTVLMLGSRTTSDDPLLRPRVSLFASAADAERYLNSRFDELAQTAEVSDLTELDLPAGIYDDGSVIALSYAYEFPDGVVTEGARVFVQDGEYVYELALAGFTAPDLDVLLTLLDDAITCGQQGCAEPMNAPVELLDYLDGQREIARESGS